MPKPIYLALDFPSWQQAGAFLKQHELQGVPVKVGMELFYKEGPAIIEKLKLDGHQVFLDLKLHDIPNTVQRAMKNVAQLGVDVINVHALGGSRMIEAAKEGLIQGAQAGEIPQLLAVTLLTSMDEGTLKDELNINDSLNKTVLHLAQMTKKSGGDGVVCSAHEAQAIKEVCGTDFAAVTPGIRLADSNSNDQKRIATPAGARASKADAIVIGRSITQAANPKEAYRQTVEEWENGEK